MKKLLLWIHLFFSDRSRFVSLYFSQEDRWKGYMIERDTEIDKWKTELYRLIAYLTDGTWKDGDSIAETIDDHQERKYMKIHREDVITILTENPDPEEAASALLEYFEILDDNGVLKPKE